MFKRAFIQAKEQLIILILIFNILSVSAQEFVRIEFDNSFDFHTDTSWLVDNIDLKLNCHWGPEYIEQSEALQFGGKLGATFDAFDYIVDSIEIINLNVCTDCTTVTFYKKGYGKRIFHVLKDSTIISNPWDFNPDSIVFSAGEALFRYQTIYYNKATNIEHALSANDILVYPNPSNSYINIATGLDYKGWNIYNQTGILVMSSRAYADDTNNNGKIIVNQLPEGIYFIELGINNGPSYLKKIVVY